MFSHMSAVERQRGPDHALTRTTPSRSQLTAAPPRARYSPTHAAVAPAIRKTCADPRSRDLP